MALEFMFSIRKKMRNEFTRLNFVRLNENNASEIDEKIEQTYLSLQEEIKTVDDIGKLCV